MNALPIPTRGLRFFHARWLNPTKMPERIPQMFEVSAIRSGAIYFRPVYRYATGRVEVGKTKDFVYADKWETVCLRPATPDECAFGDCQ